MIAHYTPKLCPWEGMFNTRPVFDRGNEEHASNPKDFVPVERECVLTTTILMLGRQKVAKRV